jgi:hypothetical protein
MPNIVFAKLHDRVHCQGRKERQMSWTPFVAGSIEIYRNGIKIVTYFTKSGTYSDTLGAVSGTFVYKICTAGTSTCSNDATVVF